MIINMFERLRVIHGHFIQRRNPYLTQEQVEAAYPRLIIGQFLAISAIACFTLSLCKVFPRVSLNVGFKKFTVFQAASSLLFLALYARKLDELGQFIPEAEIERRK